MDAQGDFIPCQQLREKYNALASEVLRMGRRMARGVGHSQIEHGDPAVEHHLNQNVHETHTDQKGVLSIQFSPCRHSRLAAPAQKCK